MYGGKVCRTEQEIEILFQWGQAPTVTKLYFCSIRHAAACRAAAHSIRTPIRPPTHPVGGADKRPHASVMAHPI